MYIETPYMNLLLLTAINKMVPQQFFYKTSFGIE